VTLLLVPNADVREANPCHHPSGPQGGQFAPKNTCKTAYHGTTPEAADRIKTEGIRSDKNSDRRGRVPSSYLTTSERRAHYYANYKGLTKQPDGFYAGRRAIVRVEVPKNVWRKRAESDTESDNDSDYQLPGDVPAEWVTGISILGLDGALERHDKRTPTGWVTTYTRKVKEFNPCHEPAGSVIGGRFAPKKGGSCGTQTSGTAGGGRAGVSAASRPTPNAAVQDVAAKYAVSLGLPVPRGGYAPVDQNLAGQIADAYDALPVADLDNPAVVRAYTALAAEVQAQWDFAEAQGMTFTPWTKDGQPYQTSVEMAEDVQKNKHLAFFTGGDDHPFLGSSTKDKRGLTLNDKFRAIHDYFGHAAGGYGFGARGEENAWISHSQMFTPMARRAMTTETRGQNSWVNFGRQNYDADGTPKNIPAGDRPFATQKVALLPDRFVFG
jgi:hypothetical protein